MSPSAMAQVTIFDYGSSWKYLDNGSNQATAWSSSGFTDATWSSGAGYFGYGDPWITTCVNACGTVDCNPGCAVKYVTTYFRKVINIADTALYDSIRLSAFRDDGIVVYVNGVEVWRDNMPTGTIAYNTLANSPAIGGADETTPVSKSIPISAFISGNNTIAVELHQQALNSSDLTFNMQALGIIRTKIVNYGSPWKYLITTTDQGTAWRPSAYSDAAWSTGVGHIGFGETWTTTCIPAGPSGCTAGCMPGSSCTKYTTTYFRKSVNLPDLTLYDSLKFSMFRDDGIVMYVNGAEVWRDNMPTGTIAYSTLAPNNITGTTGVYAESLAVVKAIPVSAFTTGNNIIAIELHQNSSTSSDLDFNVQMTGVLRAPAVPVTLSRGPYLQMGNQTAVSVRWRTNVASRSRLSVGTVAGTYPVIVNDAAALTEHELRVTGLSPDTKYFYRIGTDTSIIQGDTANFFVTAPTDTTTRSVTIAAYGDCGRNDNSFQSTTLAAYRNYLAAQNKKAADLMLLVGDNAYDAGTDLEFTNNFFSAYSGNILRNHMLFPAPGNHDYANNGSRQVDHNVPYYNIFTMPTAGECGGVPSGTEAYYSYNWGNIHILSLDSYGEEDAGTTRLYDTLGAQVAWIKSDLAANTKKWVIAYWHHPPFTMGSHNSDNEGELVSIRQNFIRILERYGVDVIICGHSHDYERSFLLKNYYGSEASFNVAAHTADSSSGRYNGSNNSCPYVTPSGKVNHGTVYVVSGSAGADGGVQSGYPHNAMPFSIDDGGMFYLDIKGDRLDAKFLRRDNTIGDQFSIMKDAKVKDTVTILAGQSVDLKASWQGAYAWGAGNTGRTISVTPANDTTIIVKDSLVKTCLSDSHFINVECTMPAFTSCPGNIIRTGCDATVTYTVADTARPAPSLSYVFSGATTGSGNGSGSGATFSIGVTSVTVTATNSCGSATCSFSVTVAPLPQAYSLTGGGGYCPGGGGLAIGLAGSQAGVTYQLYNGAAVVGSPVAGTGSTIGFGTYTAIATYTVLATDDVTGCTNAMDGNTSVFLHSLPVAYAVTGTGSYCAGGTGVAIGLANTQVDVNYQLYNGASALGSAVAGTGSALSFGSYTAAATYSVVATDALTGCVSDMSGFAVISIDPLPLVANITGGGNYCATGAGVSIGLDGSESGISYQLYSGASSVGAAISGTSAALSFGAVTAAGVYTVWATNSVTGCAAHMAGSAEVVVDPLPVAYTVTGGGSYCSGGAGRAVGLDNTQSGISYQLYNGAVAIGAPVTGTTTAIGFGAQGAAGTYTVTATDVATSCTAAMSGAAVISIDPLPAVYSVTGGGHYCAGGSGVAIGLGGSATGISYQLYNGSLAQGAAVSGTGAPLALGMYPAAGTYSLVAVNAATGCASDMLGSVAVAIDPVVTPAVTLSSSAAPVVCAGTSVTFTAAAANAGSAPVYQWRVNNVVVGSANTYTYTPANGNVVAVSVTGNAVCASVPVVRDSVTMVVRHYVTPFAGINIVPGKIVCAGTAVTCNALASNGGTAPAFTWLRNGIIAATGATYTFTPHDTDNILLQLTSNAPCLVTAAVYSSNLAVQVAQSYFPVVEITGNTGTSLQGQPDTLTATVTNAGTAPVYQWIINSTVITGATSPGLIHTFANNDSVSCVVTPAGDCGFASFSSVIMHVRSLGVLSSAYTGSDVLIMPNPNKGTFTITGTMPASVAEAAISVTDVIGQVVYKGRVSLSKGYLNERIVLGDDLAAGIYFLNIDAEAGKLTYRILINK